MLERSSRNSRIRLAAVWILAPLAVGWLAGGSCSVAGCYEDCDPCFQHCQCKEICRNPLVGEGGLRVVEHETRVLRDDRAEHARVLDVRVGPSLEFTPGSVNPARIADFARAVLEVNAGLFTAQRDPAWRLDAVHVLPDRTAVQFALESSRRANSVTLLFDARGRLLEATHVVDRVHD